MHKHTYSIVALLLGISAIYLADVNTQAYITPGEFVDAFGEDAVDASENLTEDENTGGRARSRRQTVESYSQASSSVSSVVSVSSVSSAVSLSSTQSTGSSSSVSSRASEQMQWFNRTSSEVSEATAAMQQSSSTSVSSAEAITIAVEQSTTSVITSSAPLVVVSSSSLPRSSVQSSSMSEVELTTSSSNVSVPTAIKLSSSSSSKSVALPIVRTQASQSSQYALPEITPYVQQQVTASPVKRQAAVAVQAKQRIHSAAPTMPPLPLQQYTQYMPPVMQQFPGALPPQWIASTTASSELSETGVPHSVLAILVAMGSTSSLFYIRRTT